MISRDYCVMMSRYNAWQNQQMLQALETLPVADLQSDRGAFFGSLLGTANHLLWGDLMWMSRFDGGPKPAGGIPESPELHPTLASWSEERFRTDGRIRLWAETLGSVELNGELNWYSGALGEHVSRPMALCVAHMFNHQTHHRGQIHAMLTAAGVAAPVSDLFVLPEDV
ncbi:MAG: DinB family protein [Pseudomonadota bacterium]